MSTFATPYNGLPILDSGTTWILPQDIYHPIQLTGTGTTFPPAEPPNINWAPLVERQIVEPPSDVEYLQMEELRRYLADRTLQSMAIPAEILEPVKVIEEAKPVEKKYSRRLEP